MSENPWLKFLISALAVYRLSGMFATEVGPGRIFERLRKVGRNRTLKEGLSCPLCESVWWAGLCVGGQYLLGWVSLSEVPFWWLGVSGFAVVLWRQWPKG